MLYLSVIKNGCLKTNTVSTQTCKHASHCKLQQMYSLQYMAWGDVAGSRRQRAGHRERICREREERKVCTAHLHLY